MSRYRAIGACLLFDAPIERGRSYELVVSARDRPTARARTTVPGAFAITRRRFEGDPPGTEGYDVLWHSSAGAYGYFAYLQSSSNDCEDVHGCPNGWIETTRDTAIAGSISTDLLAHGTGDWTFGLLALDRALYNYFTSGTGDHFFSVPPVENVEGGRGVFGSWAHPTQQ